MAVLVLRGCVIGLDRPFWCRQLASDTQTDPASNASEYAADDDAQRACHRRANGAAGR